MSTSFRDAEGTTRFAGGLHFGAGIQLAAVQVVFTNAQIKQCPVTPLTVVAAPGAGLCVFPVSTLMALDSRGGAYATCTNLFVALSNGAWSKRATWPYSEFSQGAFRDASAVHLLGNFVGPYTGSATNPAEWYADRADAVDKPLTLAMFNNGGANPAGTDPLTGGNAANTLTVSSVYALIWVAS